MRRSSDTISTILCQSNFKVMNLSRTGNNILSNFVSHHGHHFIKEQHIPVVADWVVSIMEPIDDLLDMYTTSIQDYERKRKISR